MNRRAFTQIVLFAAAAAESQVALASNVLETSTFVLTLPAGWKRDLTTLPVSAAGPEGEMLQISSSRISGPAGASAELQEIRVNVEAVAIRTLRLAETEPSLSVEQPLSRTVLTNGAILNEIVYRSKETGWKIAQFSVIGPRTAVLVSLRVARAQASSIDAVRGAVTSIAWLPQ